MRSARSGPRGKEAKEHKTSQSLQAHGYGSRSAQNVLHPERGLAMVASGAQVKAVAVLGAGIMGSAMARRLLSAGYR